MREISAISSQLSRNPSDHPVRPSLVPATVSGPSIGQFMFQQIEESASSVAPSLSLFRSRSLCEFAAPFGPSILPLSLPPSGLIGHAKCPQPVSLPASLFSASVAVADAAAARFAEYPLRHEYPRLSCTSLTITIHKKEGSVPGHVLYCNPVTPCRHIATLPTSEFR